MSATLILLNGPPASGKSTIADLLVRERPLALSLDIDVVRSRLGGWLDHPHESGLAARTLAISMIVTHLRAGHDVVVPQLLARPEFIEQLEAAAATTAARFVEIALDITRSEAIDAFDERRRTSTHPIHRDAAELVERTPSSDPIGEMYDSLQRLLGTRPTCHRIRARRGDIDVTVAAVRRALSDDGIDW